MSYKKLAPYLVACILFILNLALIFPYFSQRTPGWVDSIEVSFIGMARMWKENFPHIWWNPYWYAGFPMRFSYAPIVPMVTALLGLLIGNFGRAYHLFTGVFYAAGAVTLFFWLRYLTKSTVAACIGGLIFSLWPSMGDIFPSVRAAQGMFGARTLLPWRMIVMVYYGEGPHTVAQVFVPLAGLFYLKALQEKKQWMSIATSFCVAFAALSNPIGLWATGLFMASITIVALLWQEDKKTVVRTVAMTVLLSYLFTAFWYTPGFIQSDFFKEGGGIVSTFLNFFPWRPGFLLVLGVSFLFILRRIVPSEKVAAAITWFAVTFFVVGVFYQFGVEFSPQARRYIPELDMAGISVFSLGVAFALQFLRRRKGSRIAVFVRAIILTFVVIVAKDAIFASWWFTSTTNTNHLEEKLNDWLSTHVKETERVFLSANYSFWANVSTNVWQMKGGHWQASINPWERHASYQITSHPDGQISLLWLKTFAISWILMNGKNSSVHYRDYSYPEKFQGLLGSGECVICPTDVMYRVPLLHGMAGPVKLAALSTIPIPHGGDDKAALTSYVSWLEENRSVLSFVRMDNDHYRITGNIPEDYGVRVAMSYDPGWRATDTNGQKLTIAKDPLGFLLMYPKSSGPIEIELSYGPTLDLYFGWVLFASGIGFVFMKWKIVYA